jgi:2-haloacid dehalogenase
MLDLSKFQVISFDCYGTLIDWETGILGSLRKVLPGISDQDLLTAYSESEPAIQAREYQRYREVLREVLYSIAQRFGSQLPRGSDYALADSIRDWLPFPDTVAALKQLKTKFKLAVISNIDDDLFAHTARRLEVPFDWVITAEQARAYKPSLSNFALAEQRIGLPRSVWLHAAESLFHDAIPARKLGITSVWVNRRGNKDFGATKMVDARPDLEVPDLRTLAEMAVSR